MVDDRPIGELQQIAYFADELPAAIWVGMVPGGECVYVNKAFRSILGIDPPEGAARGNYVGPYGLYTWSGDAYPERGMPYERAIAAGAPVVVDDIVLHRHDGGRTYLRVFARPLFDDAGTITHVVEAFTDISREVESERARYEVEQRLRLTQRMESLGSLAGGIAHDFNNLLAVIKLVASHLAISEKDPAKREALRQIDDVTESAVRLTRSLLGFARKGTDAAQPVSLNDIVRSATELSQRVLDRQLHISCELCEGPLDVVGDATQLDQLIMNLVLNARDAIEGEGSITLRTFDRVSRGLEANDPCGAVLEVVDTGSGIAPALRERVFEPYFTTKTTGAVKGTGLGLSTVYGITQSHRGRVEIANSGPEGTTMRVAFPPAPARPPPPDAIVERPRERATAMKRGTVLVVDDEPLVREVTACALVTLGYSVLVAADGPSAIEALRGADEGIEAVVLDMVMPRMDGRATYLALRDLDPTIAVVLTTGCALDHDAQEILDLGVRAFLPKPFSVDDLASALARCASL